MRPTPPPEISHAALDRRCPGCVETLDLFVAVLGAEAGNTALRGMTTGGVFLGGGIPPKILPALEGATFLDAFRAKAPMEHLVAAIPVHVIVHPNPALLGAAVAAAHARGRRAPIVRSGCPRWISAPAFGYTRGHRTPDSQGALPCPSPRPPAPHRATAV